jgi:hypothetical protein
MRVLNKCDLLRILSWVFITSVAVQGLYSGLKFDCWWGLAAAGLGCIIGFGYARYKSNWCVKQ